MDITDKIIVYLNEAIDTYGNSVNVTKYPALGELVTRIIAGMKSVEYDKPAVVDYRTHGNTVSVIMAFKAAPSGSRVTNDTDNINKLLGKFYSNHRCTLNPKAFMSQPGGRMDSEAADALAAYVGRSWGTDYVGFELGMSVNDAMGSSQPSNY